MKKYLLVLVSVVLILALTACKKNQGFDPMTKGVDDFIGTWHGSITTFKNNKLIKETGDVMIYRESSEYLAGIIFMNEPLYLRQFQFQNGTLYFRITNNDPLNPNCQTWNLGGYAIFSEEGKIDFRISGNECGAYGSEYVDWNGTLAEKQVDPDSLRHFYFAAAGNAWNYKVTLKRGDSCTLYKQINGAPSGWYFPGESTHSCGWADDTVTMKWNLTPADFTTLNDSTLSFRPITFPITAKPGVVYRNITDLDTTTVTLVDTNLLITTAAGNFICLLYRYTEPALAGEVRFTKIAHIWLDRRYGVIRQEVENPADNASIRILELTSKSF